MKFLGRLTIIVSLLALTACGGGGGNAKAPTPSPGGGDSQKVANFEVTLNKSALLNNGLDEANLTVIALDANNNPVPDVNVKVAASSGIYTPGAVVTDASGKASGAVSIGGDKSNREIELKIDVGGKVKSEVISVTGSELDVTVPAVVEVGKPVSLSVTVNDAKNTGISNVDVVFGGTLGFSGGMKTNSSGIAEKTLSAPAVAGRYTVQVTASGVTTTREVQIGTSSGGGVVTIPDAVGPISAATLSITPNTIATNAAASTLKRAVLKAVFRDAQNRAIENVRVRFDIISSSLANEAISTGTSTVYTNANGVANSEYVAGTMASPTNGVVIRACYGVNDAAIAGTACPASRTATMTVAAEALSVTLGDNNKLERGRDELTYIKRFVVAVADAAGNAVPNAEISKSVDLPRYLKGPAWDGVKFACMNKDTNRNGFLDGDEDLDGSGQLTPRKADIVISGDTRTDVNGMAVIKVEYAQNFATWLEYEVKVTTNVAGSEGTVQKSYITDFIEGDETNGSFLTPAYGRNACNVAN